MNKCKIISIFATILLLAICCVFIFLYFYWKPKEHENYQKLYFEELISQINNNKNSTFRAKYNPYAESKSAFEEYMAFLVAETRSRKITISSWSVDHYNELITLWNSASMKEHAEAMLVLVKSALPSYFDSREKWTYCPSLHFVPNQGACGSCYAVSAASVASDRLCIHSNGTFRSLLSAQDVLTCCDECGDCFGGESLKTLVHIAKNGIVTGGRDGCKPYEFDTKCGAPCAVSTYKTSQTSRKCIKSCQKSYYHNDFCDDKRRGAVVNYPNLLHKMKIRENTPEIRTKILQTEILYFGPVAMTFLVTEEFLHYSEGIFLPNFDELNERKIFWHVVRVIGWGTDSNGKIYWICVNSFGNHWGDHGLFKIGNDYVSSEYQFEFEGFL